MSSDMKVAEIIRMNGLGMSARSIALRLGKSKSYIRSVIDRHVELPTKREMTAYEYAYRNWERARAGARAQLEEIR